MNSPMKLRAHYYQQFDADFDREVPGEGYGGWKKTELEISREHTAVVLMHAWDCGTRGQYPGWHRAVEYIPRANKISRSVFPRLLAAVRASGFRLYHIVGSASYCQGYPGYRRAVDLAGPRPPRLEVVKSDPVLDNLKKFRAEQVFPGSHNTGDIERGWKVTDFLPEARPAGEEGVVEDGHQLFALCKADGVNHLVYAGFAINWCLLLSPGGMHEMSRRGVMCSALRQAVTAVESKETAREELCKEVALWRVAVAFGFVFDLDDFIRGLLS
ncbi:MAG: hypothetical protein HYU36_14615 [Planctomycetes bacterium]|nr:hypothetical protein [Planctomycetota bacterium]